MSGQPLEFSPSIQEVIDAYTDLHGDAPITVNADVLAAAGLLKSRGKPLKVLGTGELKSKLFVLADYLGGTSDRDRVRWCGHDQAA